jgi:FAD-dependent oxidoreductase domain-containing protein 1
MLPCRIVTDRANVLIVGGGIIGTSVAWALAEAGVTDVVVLDLDLAGIYASSELNAGGARATWWHPVNIDSCRETLDFFRAHSEAFGFRQPGYLWLYADREKHARALAKRALQKQHGIEVEALDPIELAARFPLIDRNREELVGATFSPGDGLVNPNAVRQWYRHEAERMGVRFCNRHYVSGVSSARVAGVAGTSRRVTGVEAVEVLQGGALDDAGTLRRILVTHHVPSEVRAREARIECDALVNCLGAWSPVFSAKIGISDVTEPIRRQISLLDVHRRDVAPGVDLASQGMIVDASDVYFHPEGPHVLAGYSIPDESPGFDFDYDGEAFFEAEIWPRLAHRCSSFERCGHVRGWAGLYAVTPDRSGIAGRVDGFTNLFEAHSFTGRGVMQSYAVGRALAALLRGEAHGGFDIGPLTRRRFADPARWVLEELHI